jgi:hypothetical protein
MIFGVTGFALHKSTMVWSFHKKTLRLICCIYFILFCFVSLWPVFEIQKIFLAWITSMTSTKSSLIAAQEEGTN